MSISGGRLIRFTGGSIMNRHRYDLSVSSSKAQSLRERHDATLRSALHASLSQRQACQAPFLHWTLSDTLPVGTLEDLSHLPFVAPDLGGLSGTREMHNHTRRYFDAAAISTFPVCRAVAEMFQSSDTADLIQDVTGAGLDETFLRIEFAQDRDGFWLAPHTDLGVKAFTLICYLDAEACQDIGTDLYFSPETWAKRIAFKPGDSLMFVPSDRTWHGFDPRPIQGVRKSLIINYVTSDWRDREQLAFPSTPVKARRLERDVHTGRDFRRRLLFDQHPSDLDDWMFADNRPLPSR